MALQQHVPDSNLVETNTFYKGDRYTTAGHRETLKVNGWDFCTVDIMDDTATNTKETRRRNRFFCAAHLSSYL